jgi:dihydrofolate reductase
MSPPQVHVYIATSLDGFIAGPGDDLSWLTGPEGPSAGGPPKPTDPGALSYEAFTATVGTILMGRGTYDVVRGFDMPWFYGEMPILVATRRPLDEGAPPTVRALSGDIREMVAEAKRVAAPKNVYIDGGVLIRQAAEADLIDELTITVAPIALGAGHPLFAGMSKRYPLEVFGHYDFPGGMVQLRARPKRG